MTDIDFYLNIPPSRVQISETLRTVNYSIDGTIGNGMSHLATLLELIPEYSFRSVIIILISLTRTLLSGEAKEIASVYWGLVWHNL